MFGQLVLWQVGALNYFWSLTALVLFIMPYLMRFRCGKDLMKTRWHGAAFCIYAFFFGWYSEIASFVGMCLAVCLVILDAWMNRRKFQWFRLLPVLTAALGYWTMLSMPAQTANKQGAGLTLEILQQRLTVCNEMLAEYLLVLLVAFSILFICGILRPLPPKTMVVSALFALAGVCANYMPLAASYYPERCLCVPVLMLIMALLFLLSSITSRCRFRNVCLGCLLIFCLTFPKGVQGCRDIVSCHRQHIQREQIIYTALQNGDTEVIANTVIPQTEWSGYWGIRDLTDDPDTWPNHSMAVYYGLDSLASE